jgi:hypothetical protein
MKRIDDKIKEIEKKDKMNRILYIAFVVLIGAFMAYVLNSEKKIKTQGEKIDIQEETINETKVDLKRKNDSLIGVVETLKNSMTPEGFWKDTQEIGTTKSFINYVTYDDDKIKISYRAEALEKIKDEETKGKVGWLYCGKESGNLLKDGVCIINYRDTEEEFDENSVPEEGDILALKVPSRYLYSSYNGAKNKTNQVDSWFPGVNAFVLQKESPGGNAIYLKIKY